MQPDKPLSYSQNMEDYHLHLAFAGKERGTYIDIGGGHPVAGSASFWFYERGWSGIVVEPQSDLALLHRRIRPRDTIVEAVIGQSNGTIEFFKVDRFHALSTTVKGNAEAARAHGVAVEAMTLPSITLADLCQSHGLASLDFLKVDVEGAERDVLLGADWSYCRPGVIVLEAVTPGSNEPAWADWEPLLIDHGYQFALFDTLNRFYVASERSDLIARMPRERAPWDAVTHMYEIGLAPENAKHPDFALSEELTRGFWASLPLLDGELLAKILARGRNGSAVADEELLRLVRSEAFLASLCRIACGYDGGFIP